MDVVIILVFLLDNLMPQSNKKAKKKDKRKRKHGVLENGTEEVEKNVYFNH